MQSLKVYFWHLLGVPQPKHNTLPKIEYSHPGVMCASLLTGTGGSKYPQIPSADRSWTSLSVGGFWSVSDIWNVPLKINLSQSEIFLMMTFTSNRIFALRCMLGGNADWQLLRGSAVS